MDNISILRLKKVDTSRADEVLEKLGMLEKEMEQVFRAFSAWINSWEL